MVLTEEQPAGRDRPPAKVPVRAFKLRPKPARERATKIRTGIGIEIGMETGLMNPIKIGTGIGCTSNLLRPKAENLASVRFSCQRQQLLYHQLWMSIECSPIDFPTHS